MRPCSMSMLRHLALLMVLSALAANAGAQIITGTIAGTVRDPSGSVVPGVSIRATNTATGLRREASTDSEGRYIITLMPVGTYDVAAERAGFSTAAQRNVAVQIDREARTDFVLEVGGLTDIVEVQAAAQLVQTTTSDIGEIIENRRVTELPLNGRQFVQLALLAAGATPEARFNFSSPFAVAGGSPGVNGNSSGQNNYLLDGVSVNDNTYNHIALSPSIDAIQEFKIQSSMYSAEFGSSSGAQINVTLKSGANIPHGSMYEFFRDDALDARNYFDRPIGGRSKPAFRQNQYGATLGGPIRKNRLFLFGNYEGLGIHKGVGIGSAVPTDAMRAGDFRGIADIYDPLTYDPTTGKSQQFSYAGQLNVIPPDRINLFTRELLSRIPIATVPGLGRNFLGTSNRVQDAKQFNTKIDYNIGASDMLFARFSYSDIDDLQAIPGAASAQTGSGPLRPPGFGQTTAVHARNGVVSYTKVFRSNLVNQARFGYQQTAVNQIPEIQTDFITKVGLRGVSTGTLGQGVPVVNITGFSIFGDSGFDLVWQNRNFSFVDDFNWTRGSHTLKVGGLVDRIHTDPAFSLTPRGQFNFRRVFTINPDPSLSATARAATGNAFADFLLGTPNEALAGVGDSQLHGRGTRFAAYFQDDWRASQSLTFNLGVRWETVTPYKELNNKLSALDPATGRYIVASEDGTLSPDARVRNFPTLTFLPSNEAGYPISLIDGDYNNVAPRLGFAYAPGEGDTVLRGGYGVFYDRQGVTSSWGVFSFNAPFFSNLNILTSDLRNPPVVQTMLTDSTASRPASQGLIRDTPAGYVQQWTAGIQRRLNPRLAVEATYLGSHSSKLTGTIFPNQAFLGSGPQSSRVPYPLLGAQVRVSGPFDRADYESLMLRATARDWHRLQFTASYAWSRNRASTGGQDQHAARDYGPAASDIPHRFTFNSLYQVPTFGNGSGVLGKLFADWTIVAIATLQSGTPLTPRLAIDRSDTGFFQDRPNMVGDPNDIENRTPDHFFNTAAFELQPAGQFGNTPLGAVRGPRYDNLDMSLIKDVRLPRDTALQLRFEVFNVTNTPHFHNPNMTFGTTDFGVIFGADDAREIQLAVKYIF